MNGDIRSVPSDHGLGSSAFGMKGVARGAVVTQHL